MTEVTLWKSKGGDLTGPAAITCSCGHKYDGGVPRCPSCNATTAAKTAEVELNERATERARTTGEPLAKALDAVIREDPALYARHDREVKSEKKRAAVPTAEEARDAGRRLNGRPSDAGPCPRCKTPLPDTRGRFCSVCGCELPALKTARPAPAPRMSAGQAFIEAAVAALVEKTNTSRRDAYDAVMKTPEGKAAYLNHLDDLGTGDCS